MSDLIPEEMLSAYLDNELSDEERARVERHLEENAVSRQTLAEISDVREAIQRLPRLMPSPSFTSTVMQRLANSESSDGLSAINVSTVRVSSPRARLRWAASLVAIAASLVLAMFAVDLFPTSDLAKQALPNGSPKIADDSLANSKDLADNAIDVMQDDVDRKLTRSMNSSTEKLAESSSELKVVEAVTSTQTQQPSPPRPPRTPIQVTEAAIPEAEVAVAADEVQPPIAPSDYDLKLEYVVDARSYGEILETVTNWKAALSDLPSRRSRAMVPGTKFNLAKVDDVEFAEGELAFVANGTPQDIASLLAQMKVPLSVAQTRSLKLERRQLAEESSSSYQPSSQGAQAAMPLDLKQSSRQQRSFIPNATPTHPPDRLSSPGSAELPSSAATQAAPRIGQNDRTRANVSVVPPQDTPSAANGLRSKLTKPTPLPQATGIRVLVRLRKQPATESKEQEVLP